MKAKLFFNSPEADLYLSLLRRSAAKFFQFKIQKIENLFLINSLSVLLSLFFSLMPNIPLFKLVGEFFMFLLPDPANGTTNVIELVFLGNLFCVQ